jgi:hypothetical protein
VVGVAPTAAAWRWTGPLSALGDAHIPEGSTGAPGILVIGDVVAVAHAIEGTALDRQEAHPRSSSL